MPALITAMRKITEFQRRSCKKIDSNFVPPVAFKNLLLGLLLISCLVSNAQGTTTSSVGDRLRQHLIRLVTSTPITGNNNKESKRLSDCPTGEGSRIPWGPRGGGNSKLYGDDNDERWDISTTQAKGKQTLLPRQPSILGRVIIGRSSWKTRKRRLALGDDDDCVSNSVARNGREEEEEDDDISSSLLLGSSTVYLTTNNNKKKNVDQEYEESERTKRHGMWPPWPFNKRQGDGSDVHTTSCGKGTGRSVSEYKSSAGLFWMYFRERARIGYRQFQHVRSGLTYHLPPAAPPILLLAILPAKRQTAVDAVSSSSSTPRMFYTHGIARKIALVTLGISVLSWAQYEIGRSKRLVPLPLKAQYTDFKRVVLPPFLPEELPPPELDLILMKHPEEEEKHGGGMEAKKVERTTDDDDEEEAEKKEEERDINDDADKLISIPQIKRHINYLYKSAPKPHTLASTIRDWRRMRHIHRREIEDIRRRKVLEELMTLQQLKKDAERKAKSRRRKGLFRGNTPGNHATLDAKKGKSYTPLGYALVTGASRGIGRALAVELARWEIPLILVARDIDRLTALATEIEACYGVRCCVIQADLAKAGTAERIYDATSKAGLHVDVLVNNAGVCLRGEAVDMSPVEMERMVQVNAMSVATLSHLYGRDMKAAGRGRMLFVSSVVGCVPAGPGVATYAATKAFERSLALSMGKELEPYGVGVTCLMPGAVRGTAFAAASNSEDAVCWKVPFYPKSAPMVANSGVRAMLAGDSEVCPGWMNRAFLRILQPMLPQRLTTLIVEFAWNPFQLTAPSLPAWWNKGKDGEMSETGSSTTPNNLILSSPGPIGLGQTIKPPPRLLTLPEEENTAEEEGMDEETVVKEIDWDQDFNPLQEEEGTTFEHENPVEGEHGEAIGMEIITDADETESTEETADSEEAQDGKGTEEKKDEGDAQVEALLSMQ